MKRLKDKEGFELKKECDFSKGIWERFYKPQKISTSLRIDDDILLYFKKLAGEKKIGYQTLINTALREYTKAVKKSAA